MTQEEKQLLLKDLCARLPYGLKVKCEKYPFPVTVLYAGNIDEVKFKETGGIENIYMIKPYLRTMSSMTEEEQRTLDSMCNGVEMVSRLSGLKMFDKAFNWLNAHHFDYRGLIEKGLALEAPDGMYNKEEPEKGGEIPIPKTVDEAVKTLAKIVSKEDRDYLLENGAISVHGSMGRWIRNEWGLWTGSELKNELMNMNKGLNHPDDMSNYIIEEFIKYWNNKV